MKELNLIIENLKAILEECTASEDAVSYVNSEDAGTLKAAIEALEKQEKDRWIPVTERLPEKDCLCRVTEGDFKSVIDCHWSNRKKQFEVWSDYCDNYVTITNVTAWKPIEEPYTEEEA